MKKIDLNPFIINYAEGYQNIMGNRVSSIHSEGNTIYIRFLINANKAEYALDMVRVFCNVAYNIDTGKLSSVTENGKGSRKFNSYVKHECELLTKLFVEEATKRLNLEIKQQNSDYYDSCHVELLSLINNDSSKKNVCFEYINKVQELYVSGANVDEMSALFEMVKIEMLNDTRLFPVVSESPTKTITVTVQDNGQTFTAFNRSFPSYNQAYNFCISSDFDPAYIIPSAVDSITETAITDGQISNGLKLDLQLFGNAPTSVYTPEGVHKWGIGKHLQILYIVETTKTDKDIESMNYSNAHQYEHRSIQSAMNHMLTMQRNGWHNINLNVQVYNREQIIVEDIAYDTQFVSTTEQDTKQENRQLMEQIRCMTIENETYKGFISKYNAKKTFEAYTNEQQSINKDDNGLYWYEMLYCPLSPFCQPKGHIAYDDTIGKHGIIAYNRPLTDSELIEYELIKWKIV
jgi:hypothetical protein